MFNAGADPAAFPMPPAPDGAHWYLAVETGGESPRDLFDAGKEPLFDAAQPYLAAPRSSIILVRRGKPGWTSDATVRSHR